MKEKIIAVLILLSSSLGAYAVYVSRLSDYKQDRLSIRKDKVYNYKVRLNTASSVELDNLPGIGLKTASKIIDFRLMHKFQSIEDIKLVKGIGDAKFNKIKNYISV